MPTDPEPLAMTVHSLPLAVVDERARRTTRGRLQMALILLVCAAPVIASYLAVYVVRPEGVGEAAYGELIRPSVGVPDVKAVDLQGQEVPLRSLKGQWLLVTVGPSACVSACERRLFLQRQLREMLGRERDRVDKVWLVTDDAALSPALQQAINSGGPVQALRLAAPQVQAWLKPATGRALEDHLYVVDPMGEWMMRVPADPDPAKVKRDLDRLLRASASWDTAGRP